MSKQRWETRPLEIWAKAKEIRARWDKSIEDQEVLLGQGQTGEVDWSVAFNAVRIIEDNPVGAKIASQDEAFARRCRLASEVRGWGREICGYHHNCWGSMYLGCQQDNSEFPMRDFVIPFPCVCDQHAKRGQQPMDFSPIPRWQSDYPMYIGPRDADREMAMVDHKVYCVLKQINDIERLFGRRFDDEKLVASMKVRPQLQSLAREVSVLMTTVPSPLSVKDLYSFYTIGGLTKIDPEETLQFWRELRDEIQWRADNQIAAVGNECFRWMEHHPPSWHYLKYYRYMEQYGAICLGSQYSHNRSGPYLVRKEDGSVGPREIVRYPDDVEIKSREDAVRVMLTPDARAPHHFKIDDYLRPDSLWEFADVFRCDGAILPLWRSGVGCVHDRKEQALRLAEKGVSVLHYEGSQPGDRTDLDEKHFLDQLDIWMESQGLRKLVG